MSDGLRQISPPGLEYAQAGIAALLIGLALILVPCALYLAVRDVRVGPDASSGDRRARWAFVAAVALAALIRAVVPGRLAMMFIGYRMTADAIALFPIGHYGVGAQALYHLLLSVFPRDHRTLLAANAVMGTISVPLFATFTARLWRDRRAGVAAAWLSALVPMFVRNDLSEANHVPALLFLWAGLVLWQEFLATRWIAALAGAVPLLALAAISRPEFAAIVLALVLAAAVDPKSAAAPAGKAAGPLWVAALVFAVLVTPHLLHVLNAIRALEAESSLHRGSPADVWWYLIDRNAIVKAAFFPLGVSALAGWGVVRGPGAHRTRAALVIATLIALLVYFVDCDKANAARVGVPAGLCVTVLASAGLVDLWRRRRAFAGAAAALVVVSAVPTASFLFQPTNEEAEEALIRRARALMPPGPHVLVRISDRDLDDGTERGSATHPYFPDYLFEPPGGSTRLYPVSSFVRSPRYDAPAFFLKSYRCYAHFRPENEPPPHGDGLRSACELFERELHLEPVFEEDAPNYGDVWLNYYGDAPTLRVGLYRVVP